MSSLFSRQPLVPLAERLRPKLLSEILGQDHLLGEHGILRQQIEAGWLPSLILWGPPGTGKTTLARLLAKQLRLPFEALSALDSGVKELRQYFKQAYAQGRCLLFIDEIHRFNKAQQDALLKGIEEGIICLIGATTENPSFALTPALLSRCQTYALHPLDRTVMRQLLERALKQDIQLSKLNIQLIEDEALLSLADGDARRLLNLLEQCVYSQQHSSAIIINDQVVQRVAQKPVARYDKDGQMHYELISAFIKSMRGSDPNAALYYLARMLVGGEDPLFIARRMIIFAAEDIGNANPNALLLASSTMHAIQQIGMPEGRIPLAQCASYLACSPKSNAAYVGIQKAIACVQASGSLPVPLYLRNASNPWMQEQGYGKNYIYPHNFDQHFVETHYLPEAIQGHVFYQPTEQGKEKELLARLRQLWKDIYPY